MSVVREKREHPRAPIEIFVHEKSTMQYYIHPAVNIGPDGMHLIVDGLLDEDRLLMVEFTLPNSNRTITAATRVAWYEPQDELVFRVGIQFTQIDQDDRHAIEAYISSHRHVVAPQPMSATA